MIRMKRNGMGRRVRKDRLEEMAKQTNINGEIGLR